MTPQHFVVLLAYFKPWYWMGYRITGRERAMMLTKTGLSTYLLSHLNHVSSTLSSTFCLGVFMREAAATDSWTICSTESCSTESFQRISWSASQNKSNLPKSIVSLCWSRKPFVSQIGFHSFMNPPIQYNNCSLNGRFIIEKWLWVCSR